MCWPLWGSGLIVSVNRIERLQELPTAELSTRDRRNEWSSAFHG
jgi:hypothetical protein